MSYLLEPSLSPVVHPDSAVTFALRAPRAKAVQVAGNFAAQPVPMAVDTQGVWRGRVGPVAPGVYFYHFDVDGQSTIDPSNPWIHASLRPSSSVVVVPAPSPALYEERDVPRGTVHLYRHRSRVLGDRRGYEVYTPPGYDPAGPQRYPVLYLLHGYSDTEATWRISGRADVILDNLIASGVARPMLVVMPLGYPPLQPGDVLDEGDDTWNGWFSRVTPRLERYLCEELVPGVDAAYPTRATAAGRAIAGLSMGGGQSLSVGLGNTDRFAWVAAFSAAVSADAHYPLLADPATLNRRLALLWIGCGREDFLYSRNTALLARLDSLGVRHTAAITDGGHSWPVWHRYLAELVPQLFTDK